MSDIKQLPIEFFKSINISIPANRMSLFDKFLDEEENKTAISAIKEIQSKLMTRWRIKERIADILEKPVRILNATVGKPYETKFDFDKFNWKEITDYAFE